MTSMEANFCIFIVSHKRANKVDTYKLLKKLNYTGKVYIVIDNEDTERELYIKKFGNDKIIIFDKSKTVLDTMDNIKERNSVIYVRNEIFTIARRIGVEFFLMLDDDYNSITHRFNTKLDFITKQVKDFNLFLNVLLNFFQKTPNLTCLSIAQAGDFIGGKNNGMIESKLRIRKAMNFFICSVDRYFNFYGRMNDDVNTYILHSKLGRVFLTIPYVMLTQRLTQSNTGGLTDMYLKFGTYVKSFYSVIMSPSSVSISLMGRKNKRMHHEVAGNNTYPMILNECYK